MHVANDPKAKRQKKLFYSRQDSALVTADARLVQARKYSMEGEILFETRDERGSGLLELPPSMQMRPAGCKNG